MPVAEAGSSSCVRMMGSMAQEGRLRFLATLIPVVKPV